MDLREAERILRPGRVDSHRLGPPTSTTLLHALRKTHLREVNHIIWATTSAVSYEQEAFTSLPTTTSPTTSKPGGERDRSTSSPAWGLGEDGDGRSPNY